MSGSGSVDRLDRSFGRFGRGRRRHRLGRLLGPRCPSLGDAREGIELCMVGRGVDLGFDFTHRGCGGELALGGREADTGRPAAQRAAGNTGGQECGAATAGVR